MKWLLILISVFLLVFNALPVFSVDCTTSRCATCDLCGYCWQLTPVPPAKNPPSNWESCRNCLYPQLTGMPVESNSTLSVDNDNNAITPYPGNWYTAVGCISAGGSFTEQGAAGNVIQIILSRLIFSTIGGIAFLYLIYGAFLLITSQNSPEKLNQGKRVLYGALIGIIFSLGSLFLVNLIATGILKIPGFGQ
jgi:hypothetical protein